MSDDEYYYDEFDEFHEMLYDADPAPDLADDLAERAAYSPVWQDNPTEDLRDYFSDWEYYSDDYFDDDPKLLNGGATDEAGQHGTTKQSKQTHKRGRKRKLSEAREPPKLKRREMDALAACLRGTVWKGQSPEPTKIFKAAEEEPVALRLNAEIMRSAYSKRRGFGNRHMVREETWANDLSLADMGLKTERSMSFHERPAKEEQEEADEAYSDDQDPEDENAIEDDDEEMADTNAVETEIMVEEPYRIELQAELDPIESSIVQSQIEESQSPRKRRKLGTPKSGNDKRATLPTPDASLESEISEAGLMADEEQEVKLPARKKRGKLPTKQTGQQVSNGGKEEHENTKPATRKRKLSISELSATGSTTSSRAKRVATGKTSSDSNSVVKTAAASRPTRSRKK